MAERCSVVSWSVPGDVPSLPRKLTPFMALFAKYRPEFATFEEAMLEVLATALATPEFLYLTQEVVRREKSGTGNDQRLGTRQPAFVFSLVERTGPGTVATRREGRLRDPDVLNLQVDRMLADPRARDDSRNISWSNGWGWTAWIA